MPTPLRPNNSDNDQSGYFDMSLESLQSSIFASPLGLRQAGMPDKVADALFEFWDRSSPVGGEGSDVEFKIPDGYPQEKVLMLKTENLVFGDANVVKLTEKAKAAITTMILAEENNVKRGAVKKPYSVLLAESKMPRRSRLAFASVDLTGKTAQGTNLVVRADTSTSPNAPLPADKMPNSRTTFVWSQRVTYTDGSSNKQYIVRVYEYDDGTYGVVAFNGRIGHGLAVQPKGMFRNRGVAESLAEEVVNSKLAKGYRREGDNMQAPGRPYVIDAARGRSERPRDLGVSPAITPDRTRVAPARPRAKPVPKPEPEYNIDKVLREWKPADISELTGDDDDTPVFS